MFPRLSLIAGLALVSSPATVLAQQSSEIFTTRLLDNTLNQYCVVCHNDALLTADMSLEGVNTAELEEHSDVLEKVLRRLTTGEMPPPGMPRPTDSVRAELVTWLETQLDRQAVSNPNPGSPAIHRLNRAEHSNAIRDLLGIDLYHTEDVPADAAVYGFNNIGDV